MKKLLLAVTVLFTASLSAQTINAPITLDNLAASGQAGVVRTKAASIEAGSLTVDAVIWDGATSSFYWQRNSGGIITSNTVVLSLNGKHPDIVISSTGNDILTTYRLGPVVYSEPFTWNGTNYVSGGTTAVTPTVTGYFFSITRLDIDANDDVVLSYVTGPTSTNQGYFARAGTVTGTWVTYPNVFNAYDISGNLGLPTISHAFPIDVAMYNPSGSPDLTFFTLSYRSGGNSFIDHVRIETSDLQSNSTASLVTTNLNTGPTTTDIYGWPSIDANWNPSPFFTGNAIDEWAVAVAETNPSTTTVELVCYRGDGLGGFIRFTQSIDPLLSSCKIIDPDIAFINDFGAVVWELNDCSGGASPNVNARDVINSEIDIVGGAFHPIGNANSLRRINDEPHFTGNQMRTSMGSRGASTTVFSAYYDQVSSEIRYRHYDQTIAFKQAGDFTENESNISIKIFPNPVDNELTVDVPEELINSKTTLRISDLSGRIIYEAFISETHNTVFTSQLKGGVYIIHLNGLNNGKSHTERFVKM